MAVEVPMGHASGVWVLGAQMRAVAGRREEGVDRSQQAFA